MAVPFVIAKAKFSQLLRKYIESSDFYILTKRGKKGPKHAKRGNSPHKERDSYSESALYLA
jgi:hypothetical protein